MGCARRRRPRPVALPLVQLVECGETVAGFAVVVDVQDVRAGFR